MAQSQFAPSNTSQMSLNQPFINESTLRAPTPNLVQPTVDAPLDEIYDRFLKESNLNPANMSPAELIDARTAFDAQQANQTGFMDYLAPVAGGINALTGVASYFDNKRINDAKLAGLNQNIANAKENQGFYRDFRSGTNSAFGNGR